MADQWDRAAVGLVQKIAADLTSAEAAVAVLLRHNPHDDSIVRLAHTLDRLRVNCQALIGELRG